PFVRARVFYTSRREEVASADGQPQERSQSRRVKVTPDCRNQNYECLRVPPQRFFLEHRLEQHRRLTRPQTHRAQHVESSQRVAVLRVVLTDCELAVQDRCIVRMIT